MQVRQVNRHQFDVFLGRGFDQWSRVHRYHWGVKVVAGNRLPRQELNAVSEAIKENPHGNVENV